MSAPQGAHARRVIAAPLGRRRRAAWLVPAGVGLAVAAGSLLATAPTSAAVPRLPAKSAQQLLTAVAQTNTTAFSGTVRVTARLGLPSLPGGRDSASLSWQSLITGSHSALIWVDGPTRQRVGVLGQLSEAEIVHSGRDVWTYTSATNTATHSVLKDPTGQPDGTDGSPAAKAFDPAATAAQLLKNLDPTTAVTVDTAQTVARRAAYTIVLTPRDTRSTVRSVRIAVDAQHYLPLQVQVFGAGSSPAFQVGFSRISFATPPASEFRFAVPRGATVTTAPLGREGRRVRIAHGPDPSPVPAPTADHVTSTVIGSGWTAVLELHGATGRLAGAAGLPLDKLTTPVGTSGARLLHTALLNAVLLPDGRVFVGAVDPATAEHVAATTAN